MSKTVQTTFQIVCLLIGITAALTLHATTTGHYRWQDSEGNTHYSDRPPKGVESVFIKISTGKSSASSDPAQETPKTANKTGEKSAKGQKMMEILPEKNPELCKQAQANLTALAGARIRITEPDGSQRFLSEDEKEAQRVNARKFIDIHCD